MKGKRKKYIILSIIIAILAGGLYYLISNRWFGNKLERTIAKIHTVGKLKGEFKKVDWYTDNYYLERPFYKTETDPIDFFNYEEREYSLMGKYVDEKYVECMLDEDYYTVDAGRGEEVHLQIYKIKNIEKDAAIIVKSKKEDVAHVYYNESYQADNLKEYLQAHGINENSELERIEISNVSRSRSRRQPLITWSWNVQYRGTDVLGEVLEEMVVNGEQKKCSDQRDWSTGLELNLIDETGVGRVKLMILCNGNISAYGVSSQLFEFENGIEWGTELIKKLNEKEQGVLYES